MCTVGMFLITTAALIVSIVQIVRFQQEFLVAKGVVIKLLGCGPDGCSLLLNVTCVLGHWLAEERGRPDTPYIEGTTIDGHVSARFPRRFFIGAIPTYCGEWLVILVFAAFLFVLGPCLAWNKRCDRCARGPTAESMTANRPT